MSDTFDHYHDAMDQRDSFEAEGYEPEEDKTCRYCGTSGFHWEETDRGWRLHDAGGNVHLCAQGLTRNR